jgi:hypothetical protein
LLTATALGPVQGWDLVEPGVVQVPLWRRWQATPPAELAKIVYGGVGRLGQ